MSIQTIDYGTCTNCGICFDTCPLDVFRKVGGVVFVAYPDDCMTCYLCSIDCPEDSIAIGPGRSRPVVQTW